MIVAGQAAHSPTTEGAADRTVTDALRRIAALYAIEATIRGLPPDARLAVRQTQSTPLFADLRAGLEKTHARIPGKSELAGAIRYTLSRWEALTLVLRDGRACLITMPLSAPCGQ